MYMHTTIDGNEMPLIWGRPVGNASHSARCLSHRIGKAEESKHRHEDPFVAYLDITEGPGVRLTTSCCYSTSAMPQIETVMWCGSGDSGINRRGGTRGRRPRSKDALVTRMDMDPRSQHL